MTVIQIPDEQAAALQARAAAEGLTLEAWLRKLAGFEQLRGRKNPYRLSDLVAQCDPSAPLTTEDLTWLDTPTIGREAL